MKHMLTMLLPVFLSLALGASASTGGAARAAGNGAGSASIMHGRRLFKFQSKADFAGFRLSGARWDGGASGIVFRPDGARTDAGNSVHYGMLESPDIETGFPANQMVLSWNADTPVGSYLKVYIQVRSGGFWSRRFTYAIWNRDNRPVQRMTVNGQSDDIAAMETDILISKVPIDAFRVSIELCSLDGKTYPTLRLLTAHCIDTKASDDAGNGAGSASAKAADPPLRARKSVWGTDLPIPERSQLTIPQGNRFCSATSTSMVLEYWGKKLNRPELNVPLRTAVDGIYDHEMGGTGNWPFNTAYAAEFGGLRAYVTRFANMSQIEDWIAKGVPVIVSMDYNILMHSKEARRMGHLMVFRGFTDKGDCIINDPYTKLEEGERVRRIFNRKDFEESWLKEKGSRGAVYLIFPSNWSIPKDRYGNW